MEFRKMTAGEVSQVAELEKLCFTLPWSEKSVAGELENPLALWLVAMEGDSLAGYVGSQTVMDETDMMNLAVAPQFRRQGVGEALVNALVASLKERGSRCLTLEVRDSNEAARALYAKLGFVEIGRRREYYRDPREDALILRKEWEI
ncbi:MAG: ribosomal protein S18-alanine N-acetyltransferase [Candidatus Faecousia sp.]|nr:ribosomal protein S18-alanine N-acetyltransferase [Candidatus Faecousia sp.]